MYVLHFIPVFFQQDIALNLLPDAHTSAFHASAAMKQYLAENPIKLRKISFHCRPGEAWRNWARRLNQNEIFPENGVFRYAQERGEPRSSFVWYHAANETQNNFKFPLDSPVRAGITMESQERRATYVSDRRIFQNEQNDH